MLSKSYQLAAVDDSHAISVDPTNELYWKRERRRLSAEEIRDAMLADAGTLDRTMGSNFPFLPEAEFRYTQHVQFAASPQFDTNRRTIYQIQQRQRRRRILEVFDGPDPNTTTPDRPLSTTAIQALYLMNDPFVHERAGEFATRLENQAKDLDARLNLAYRVAYGRPPRPAEVEASKDYLSQVLPSLSEAGVEKSKLPHEALASLVRVMMASNEFLFVD